MSDFPVLAGLMSTTLFVASYLPMLYRAVTTRDLGSYSRPSLVLANVGNVIQSIYVYSLPAGPIWFLHGFYLGASALMLGLHLRHIGMDSASPSSRRHGRPRCRCSRGPRDTPPIKEKAMTATHTEHTEQIGPARLQGLRTRLRGEVVAPGDDGYDGARQAWNLNAEHRPALVVLAEDASDVRNAVRFAQTSGLGVGVLATGHGTGQPCNGGLLINTSRMRGVRVDPSARVARVEAGAIWEDVVEAAATHGLVGLPGLEHDGRRRRLHPGRRLRMVGTPLRPGRTFGHQRRGGHRRWRARHGQPERAPGPLLGTSREAPETSASSPAWSSACTRSGRCTAATCTTHWSEPGTCSSSSPNGAARPPAS